MQPISDILSRIMKQKNLVKGDDSLGKSALSNPEVKKFLADNKDKLNNKIVINSLPNLFLYVQQIQQKKPTIKGYVPQLFINGQVIDIQYKPTEQKIKSDEKKRAQQRIELIDLPLKLRNIQLENIDRGPGRKQVISDIAIFLQNFDANPHTKGLYLAGSFGVGKTYLLAALADSVARQGKKVIFLHVPSFIAGLSSHFQDNSLNDEIDRIAQAPVVIFDDIGAETLSEWSRDDVLGVILQKRMDNVLPTFFSSNLTMNDLEKHFSETKTNVDDLKAKRLMERVRFLSKEVVVEGENRRK